MGKLGKLVILILVILAIGYYADQKGYINVETQFNITTNTQETSKLWTNTNFSQAAIEPKQHINETVKLDIYVFNKLNVQSGNTTITAYEGYLGNEQQLENNPYEASKRILFTTSTTLDINTCYQINGYIAGTSNLITQSGEQIHPAYIKAQKVKHIDCQQIP